METNEQLITLHQRNLVLDDLKDIEKFFYTRQPDLTLEQFVKTKVSALTYELINEELGEASLSGNNQMAIERVISRIHQQLDSLHVIKISLAIYPSEELIREIYTWLINAKYSNFVIDVKIDRSILAGIIIDINGRYYNLSLQKRFDTVLKNLKESLHTVKKLDQIL